MFDIGFLYTSNYHIFSVLGAALLFIPISFHCKGSETLAENQMGSGNF